MSITALGRSGRSWLLAKAPLLTILGVAMLVRIAVRVAYGEEYFWANGYSAYYELAEHVVAGRGYCFDTMYAWWPPLYPSFLALTALGGKHYLLIVVPQALMGAGTALCAFLIGKTMFSSRVGLVASIIIAFYPYLVMHDTALQETGMLTFLVALSIFLLLRARESKANVDWFVAGLALAATVLTRASLVSFVPLALLWVICLEARGGFTERLWRTSIVFAALVLAVGPWLVRTYCLTGAPVLSSQTGRALWIGNNSATFSYYPNESIDLSTNEAYWRLSPPERVILDRLAPHEIQASDWFKQQALAYMRAHPRATVQAAVRKVLTAFSWTLSPSRDSRIQALYFVSYVPVAVLGILGMVLAWPRPDVGLIGLLFGSFIGVTAIFWAHTSHRSYLDVYLIIFASSALQGSTMRGYLANLRGRGFRTSETAN